MPTHIDISNGFNFQLILPMLPFDTTLNDSNLLNLNIIDTVLPSFSINPKEHPWMGGKVYGEVSDVDYGDWTVNFIIDDLWTNYSSIFKWMQNINDGVDKFGKPFKDYQVEGRLLIFDNYEKIVKEYVFRNVWPKSLGEVTMTYQDGNSILNCSCSLQYDNFYEKETI